MRRPDRRRVLAAGAATLAGLGGCTGLGDGSDGSNGDGASDSIRLESLAVAGSPGEDIAVRPPDTVALLDFFATWCGPCVPQMDELRTVRSSFPDLHMLSITWETDAEAVAEFWREHDGTWPVALDPEMTTGPAYGVDGLPTLVLVDADGSELWRHTNVASADAIAAQLEATGV